MPGTAGGGQDPDFGCADEGEEGGFQHICADADLPAAVDLAQCGSPCRRRPAAPPPASRSQFGMTHRVTWSLRALPAPAKGRRPLDPACFLEKWSQGACPLRAWAAPNSVILDQNEKCCLAAPPLESADGAC